MRDLFESMKSGAGSVIEGLRKNMWLLFLVAFVFGGAVKVVASRYVTMGYNDYLTERQAGFDFEKMKQDVATRKQEEQKKQSESDSAIPVGEVSEQ